MKFSSNNFYHIYNRGNNKQKIFLRPENYFFFLQKIKESFSQYCSILAYCLMPNHYHLLIYVNKEQDNVLPSGKMQILERKLGTLQSSYTRAINNQESRTGSLFQPKCKVIELGSDHRISCFHYIHQNPVKAGLCSQFQDWNFSSFREYIGLHSLLICKKGIAYEQLGVAEEPDKFIQQSRDVVINEKVLQQIK